MNRAERSVTRALVLLVALAALVVAAFSGCASLETTSSTAGVTVDSTTQATSGSTTTAAPDKATASAAGVTLEYPGGWYLQTSGDSSLTVAQRQEDLAAERPAGARLRLEAVSSDSADMAGLLAEVIPSGTDAADVAESFVVVEEPGATEVAGEQAASITVKEESGDNPTITRYVIVELEGGTVLLFILQAPKDRWDLTRVALDTIPTKRPILGWERVGAEAARRRDA